MKKNKLKIYKMHETDLSPRRRCQQKTEKKKNKIVQMFSIILLWRTHVFINWNTRIGWFSFNLLIRCKFINIESLSQTLARVQPHEPKIIWMWKRRRKKIIIFKGKDYEVTLSSLRKTSSGAFVVDVAENFDCYVVRRVSREMNISDAQNENKNLHLNSGSRRI